MAAFCAARAEIASLTGAADALSAFAGSELDPGQKMSVPTAAITITIPTRAIGLSAREGAACLPVTFLAMTLKVLGAWGGAMDSILTCFDGSSA